MRSVSVLIVLVLCSVAVAGQKRNITEGEFSAVQQKADDLLNASSYRLTKTLVAFSDPGGAGKVSERFLKEALQPKKWRTVHELVLDGKNIKTEVLWDGVSLFHRDAQGNWIKSSRGLRPERTRGDSDLVQTKYRDVGTVKLNGNMAHLYETEQVRSTLGVRYFRKTRFWYDPDGRFLRSIEENVVQGRVGISRETVMIEYNPKLVIETPLPNQ